MLRGAESEVEQMHNYISRIGCNLHKAIWNRNEEEARANWEERAVYHATQVTNLAGEAFETLSENRWSRRDCTEYQEELDWVMRTFRRVYDEIDIASMPAKMRRVARVRLD
jgi:hypothetical protein